MEKMVRSTKDERVTDVIRIVHILTVSMSSLKNYYFYLKKYYFYNLFSNINVEIFYPVKAQYFNNLWVVQNAFVR